MLIHRPFTDTKSWHRRQWWRTWRLIRPGLPSCERQRPGLLRRMCCPLDTHTANTDATHSFPSTSIIWSSFLVLLSYLPLLHCFIHSLTLPFQPRIRLSKDFVLVVTRRPINARFFHFRELHSSRALPVFSFLFPFRLAFLSCSTSPPTTPQRPPPPDRLTRPPPLGFLPTTRLFLYPLSSACLVLSFGPVCLSVVFRRI